MNPETIDSEYAKLEQQGDQVSQAVTAFSDKLQHAADSGDASAREWLLDLKSLALEVQQEQLQMQALLQAVHDFAASEVSAGQPSGGPQPTYAPQPGYTAQPTNTQQGGGHGFAHLIAGSFGRAIVNGAGFGIGDDVINHILR